MKDEDQTPRQVGLCCAGTLFLALVAKSTHKMLETLSFQERLDLYRNAKAAGMDHAAKAIQDYIERDLPWK